MRELKIVGLDVDGKRIICETVDAGEMFVLRPDDRLHAALRGDRANASQAQIEVEIPTLLRPKDIQARIRAGASIEQVAANAGVEIGRVERFAHPVLLERSRAAELALANGESTHVPANVTTGTTRITVPALGGAVGPWRIDSTVCRNTISMVPPHTIMP